MKKQLIDSIIKDAANTCYKMDGITKGKNVDDARLALVKEILATGQSLVQLEAVDETFSLGVMDQADKGSMMLARYAMRLAREVGNGNLTRAQIGNTITVIEIAGSYKS